MTIQNRRFLWVSNHTPFLTDFGGGQRSSLIYRALRSLGEVDVLLQCLEHTPGNTREQTHGCPEGRMEIVQPMTRGERWPWRMIRACAPALVDKLAYNFGRREVDYARDPHVGAVFGKMLADRQYDLIVARHAKFAAKSGALECSPVIIDIDDNEVDLYRRLVTDPHTKPLRRMVLARRVRSLEGLMPRVFNRAAALWVSKDEDRELPGCARAMVLPNIPLAMAQPNPPPPLEPDDDSKVLLFLGMLSYVYNREGLDEFIQRGWPLVRAAEPEARLRLAGSRLNSADRKRWAAVQGVEVVGFVEDVRTAYRDAALVMVPIWSGGGTNIKVVEALMHGRPCVVSQPACRGYANLAGGTDAALVVGATPEEMGQRCVELLRQPERRAALAARGAAAVRRLYTYDRFVRVVHETVESVLRDHVSLARNAVEMASGNGTQSFQAQMLVNK
jgi:glycosyltransferase involved in cell wall biosynthesis